MLSASAAKNSRTDGWDHLSMQQGRHANKLNPCGEKGSHSCALSPCLLHHNAAQLGLPYVLLQRRPVCCCGLHHSTGEVIESHPI